MYIITLIFMAILAYVTAEELNFGTDLIQGGIVMLEQYFPMIVLAVIVFALFKGFTYSPPDRSGGGSGRSGGGRSDGRNSGRGDRSSRSRSNNNSNNRDNY